MGIGKDKDKDKGKSIKYFLIASFFLVFSAIVFSILTYDKNAEDTIPSKPPKKVSNTSEERETINIKLPEPRYDSETSLETALLKRRSVREYTDEPLTLAEVSQLLWAAQGITDARGLRTAPSAGALYPLELYLVVGNVKNLPSGIYKYNIEKHQLSRVARGDKRPDLYSVALFQSPVYDAPAVIVIAAVYERTKAKYGERAVRYVHMEAGHAAQNVYLQAETLGLGTVCIGAFEDQEVKEVLKIKEEEQPLYLMPVGRK